MDDRRFDTVVRSFARHRSRRTLVGGLLAGGVALLSAHLRVPGAAARQGYSAQGEACFDDAQCLAADTPLVCAWNGYGSAGAACCAGIDGRCGDDAGCCGPNTCYLGTCQNLNIPAVGEACWQLPNDPDPCDDRSVCIHDVQSGDIWGACQPLSAAGPSGPTHGEACRPGVDVCVYASGAFACDYVAWTDDYRCCAYEGDRCAGNEECCYSNACVDGVCRAMAGGSGVGTSDAAGEWCGNKSCASWERCCNASCGICASGGGACPDDDCVPCPGCDSGLCFPNGSCAP